MLTFYDWPEYVALFLLGNIVGSFLNVVINRVPEGTSLLNPPSHCPNCQRPIKLYENIPLISYVLLKGKCVGCHQSISLQYPAVEAGMGILLMVLLGFFGWNWDLLFYGVFAGLLLSLSVIDIKTNRLPNPITLAGTIIALILIVLLRRDDFWIMLLGGAIGAGFLLFNWTVGKLLFRRDGVGMGDIKFAGMIGLFLGPLKTAEMFLLAIFSGALIGGVMIMLKRRGVSQTIPFGPYMAVGAMSAVLWGESLWHWYAGFAGLIRV